MAAHGSSIAALQSSLTTGLSNKADQSAFDVLEGVVATKSTPDSVDLKLSNYSTTAAMNGSIASANNATLATVAGGPALPGHSGEDHAAGGGALASELASRDATISGLQASKADASALTAYALQSAVDTSSEVDSKIAAALLGAVTTAALDTALLGKADASALAALLLTVDGLDTPLDVDTKIANALLGLATEAFVAAQLASRDASITALQASKADATLLASYATNAALSASETALQSALDAILAQLAALQLSGGGVVNAPAWAGFTTWELLRGSNVVRNLHFVAGGGGLPVSQVCWELLEPTLTTLGNFLVRSNSQSSVASASFTVGGFQLEGYAMTLNAFAWNIVRLTPGRRYSFGCRHRLGTASNLVMYVSAADNDYVGVTGTFLGTPSQGVWSTARLDFSVPPGGIARLHFGAFGGSIPGLVQQSAGTLDLYSMQSAFESR